MATDRELKSQTDLTNGLTAALEKLYGAMDRVATNSASQTQALLNFNDSMTNMSKNTGPAIENLESLNEAAVQASDTFDNRLTKSVDSLADVMHKRRKSFEKFEENLRMTKDIASILTNPLGKIIKTIPGMGKLGSAIGGVTKNTYNLFKEIQMSTSVMGKFALGAKALGSILGAGVSLGIGAVNLGLKMFTGGLSLATSAVKGFISFAINVVTSIKDIAFGIVKTVFTIPMQIASVAADIGGKLRKIIVEEIGNASEDSKRLFDHTSDVGKAVASIRQQAISLIPAFTSVRSEATKLFGDNQNYIKKTQEAVDSLGQFADIYGAQIARGTKEAFMFERASQVLGLTAQDNLYLVGEAAKNGESIYEALQRRTDAAESVSKEFGLDRKRLSTNFNKLRVDIQNFGHLSDTELYRVSARATELGLEVKGLTSIFNKFTTFEGAAQSAAQLSQAFGMNVDALDLIRAKDPMEIVYMFRDAMFQTGRSFDDLNRHEKGLLASQTGMSQEQLKMAMNFATAGKSMEETRKAMADATPEARQIKMFKNMNSSIKEFKKTLQFGSLFDAVTAGFKNMIGNSPQLRKAFTGISKGYEDIAEMIMSLGKDPKIVKALVPLGEAIQGITKLLTGPEMKSAITTGIKIITNFLSYVTQIFDKTGKSSSKSFGDKMKESFNDLFKQDGPIMTIVGGLASIGIEIGRKILAGFLRVFPEFGIKMFETIEAGANFVSNSLVGSPGYTNLTQVLMSTFNISEDDANGIVGGWTGLFERISKSTSEGGLFNFESGPFARLFAWMKGQFSKIAEGFGEQVIESLALSDNALSRTIFSNDDIEKYRDKRAKRNENKTATERLVGYDFNKAQESLTQDLKNMQKLSKSDSTTTGAQEQQGLSNFEEKISLMKVYLKHQNESQLLDKETMENSLKKLDQLKNRYRVLLNQDRGLIGATVGGLIGSVIGESDEKENERFTNENIVLENLFDRVNLSAKQIDFEKSELERKQKKQALLQEKLKIFNNIKETKESKDLVKNLDYQQYIPRLEVESSPLRRNVNQTTAQAPIERNRLNQDNTYDKYANNLVAMKETREALQAVTRSIANSEKVINLMIDGEKVASTTVRAISNNPSLSSKLTQGLSDPKQVGQAVTPELKGNNGMNAVSQ